MLKRCIFFILISCVFFAGLLNAENVVTLATLEWEPYIGPNMKNNGYVYEIVEKAFERVNYKIDVKFLPWARAVKVTEDGVRDGLFPEYYDEGRKPKYVFSNPYPGGPVGLYKRKDLNVKYSVDPQKQQTEALKALKQYKFGVVRGYVNTTEFDAASFLKKDAVASDELNLKKLFKKRIDFIFIDKYVAKHIIVTKYPHYLGELEFMEPPLENKPLYIAFSTKAKNYEQKQKAFNEGLKMIEQDGTLNKILEKHGF